MMHIAGSIRPLTHLDDLEARRERLGELISLGLVSPTMAAQLSKAVAEVDRQIAAARAATSEMMPMAMAA